MLEKYNRYKVLKIFLDSPTHNFRIRKISRLAEISLPSVSNYLKEFEKEKLIEKTVEDKIPFYKANRDNSSFVHYKKLSILFEMHNSGLIDFLWDELSPNVMILFGSFSRGEDIEGSDIDLFIQSKEKKINLSKFEKLFNREINLLIEEDFSKINKELRNNILNGITLKGYLKVF